MGTENSKSKSIESILHDALSGAFPNSTIEISELGGKYNIEIVSDKFTDMGIVKRQQLIYAPLMELITSGAIHAVNVRGYTPTEWQNKK